ncbi:unnamed protein product [Parnassius apollo]|uniref:(apollo) hypothetical protein n=1 Tax=Parnassius apollo TaxID=110799 RepID=A0A8S3X721_PARAO|nr:unnamed protein product [Parnassius apollo]
MDNKERKLCKFSEIIASKFPCLVEGRNESEAKCKVCDCYFSFGSRSIKDVQRHMESEKHKKMSKAVSSNRLWRFFPDIPDSYLLNPTCSTPSVSLLRSDAITPNLSPERNDASPSILAVRRSGSSTPDLPDIYYLSPNNSPSGQGAATTWSSDPNSMKNIEFTKEQELLVPPPTDPYEAFRLLIDDELLDLIVRETNANAIRVGKELSLDESMVLWRDRLLFRQFIKNKRHKYGIELYVLAEPDGTVLKFQVYAGANDETSGQGHSSKIVFKLLEERLDCGHHVNMDNYYNSYGLAVKLLDRQTYCTGTLRKNRKDNPVKIGSVSLEKGENKSLFLNGAHVGKWRSW